MTFFYGHLDIGEQDRFSPAAHFCDMCPIRIDTRALIGANCNLLNGGHSIHPAHRLPSTDGKNPTNLCADGAPVFISDDAWVGAGCTILQGVRIGHGVTIGAGSVVNKDIPYRCVAAGDPCRIIEKHNDLDQADAQAFIDAFRNGNKVEDGTYCLICRW